MKDNEKKASEILEESKESCKAYLDNKFFEELMTGRSTHSREEFLQFVKDGIK